MKTILILRHTKSDWSDGKADFERPLNKRGREDAPRMGTVLARFNCVPDRIVASPAQRAKQTAELVAQACGYKQTIEWQDSFYGGSSLDLIAALKNLPTTVERPLLVGHNPTLEETVAALCAASTSGWEDERVEEWAIRIPTGGLVCLDLNITDWTMLEPGDGVLRWFLIPKLVKAMLELR